MSENETKATTPKLRPWLFLGVAVVAAAVTFAVTALVANIFDRKQEAKAEYAEVVQLAADTYDPAVWGQNFPAEYDAYLKTAGFTATAHSPELVAAVTSRFEGDPEMRTHTTESKIEADPRLVTMWKGYAFAIDYRHLRGHEWMLTDQRMTLRVLQKEQPGACLNCHASTVSVMDTLGDGDQMAGFAAMNKLPYQEATALAEHPISCVDCHDPETMKLRVTRPALINGLKDLKASEGVADYDVNRDATTQEMRTYVCAQCHVEYYFAGEGKTLTFPWKLGTDINDVWQYYTDAGFTDFTNAVSGAKVVKAQHPEFEAWSEGVHAANGVTCADCHMAYERVGAKKVADHFVTSPMADINGTCGTCHTQSDELIEQEVTKIQNVFVDSRDRTLDSLVQLINAIATAQTDGTPADRIELAQSYQNFASFYVDYAYSENSYGFHAPDYFQRILNQSLDASRKGQLALLGVSAADLEPSAVAQANTEKANETGLI